VRRMAASEVKRAVSPTHKYTPADELADQAAAALATLDRRNEVLARNPVQFQVVLTEEEFQAMCKLGASLGMSSPATSLLEASESSA
jgi:hypothetical protein